MMESVLLLLISGTLNVVCFFIGAKVGQKTAKGEEIHVPEISLSNPVKASREKKKAEYEQDRIDTIMQNIETYNGTSVGQKDV